MAKFNDQKYYDEIIKNINLNEQQIFSIMMYNYYYAGKDPKEFIR